MMTRLAEVSSRRWGEPGFFVYNYSTGHAPRRAEGVPCRAAPLGEAGGASEHFWMLLAAPAALFNHAFRGASIGRLC